MTRAALRSGRLTGLGAVFSREFKGYFSSPLGYIFIVIFLVASGWLTVSRDFGRFLELRQASLDPFFDYVPWLFVVLVPAVSMRLWAEERKSGTVELLFTLPVTLEASYLGKFLAGWCFLAFSLFLTWPLVWQVSRLGDPDWGVLLAGYLGCLLLAACYLAIGMLFSALTKNQVVAFILSTAATVVFLLIGLPESLEVIGASLGGYSEQVLLSLSITDHFQTLTRGLLELGSIFFFLAFTAGWLLCGMLALDRVKAA
ncbi:MAG: ABC transporter permease subunit [Thermoanaerobaculia bacterium]|nr:ABC transporter permease subunit [Thermoanaerobaculia bacterium]